MREHCHYDRASRTRNRNRGSSKWESEATSFDVMRIRSSFKLRLSSCGVACYFQTNPDRNALSHCRSLGECVTSSRMQMKRRRRRGKPRTAPVKPEQAPLQPAYPDMME